jgi:hypothetical protein
MTSTVAPAPRNGTEDRTVIGRAAGAVTDVAAQISTTAGDATTVVARRAPAALSMSQGTAENILSALRGRSSASLALGTVFAAGVSGGMLLSRAPRILVTLAFLATTLLGGTLVERWATRTDELSGASRS